MSEKNETKPSIKRPEKWKQNIRKRLRQSGQEYLSRTGNVVKKREVQPACGDSCHMQCNTNITPEQRQDIHNKFWKLTEEQKNYYYWKYTARVKPKKRRRDTANSEEMRRDYTFKYRFELNGELINVCSKFFFATLDISARRIYYFYKQCYDEEICMPKTEALFGKGVKRVPDLEERLAELRAHIKTFSAVAGDDGKLYLPPELDLDTMYQMYVDSGVVAPLKQHWYNKIFRKEFNLQIQPNVNLIINNELLLGNHS